MDLQQHSTTSEECLENQKRQSRKLMLMTDGNDRDNDEYLQQLVSKACSYPAGSPQRQKILNEIIRVVMDSGKLWEENTPYYQDALHQTWIYFCQNPEKYDPKLASLITWLNRYLRWRLLDFRQEEAESRATRAFARPLGNEETTGSVDPIDLLEAPADIPPILEEICDWARTDFDKKLRNTIFRKRPEINAQVLILLNVLPPTKWGNIAAKFQLTEIEAKDLPNICKRLWKTIAAKLQLKTEAEIRYLPQFYSRSCYPLLKEFGNEQGYDINNEG